MYTFGQYVEDQKKDAFKQGFERGLKRAEARGVAKGEARGERWVLLEFIRQVWGNSEADRCARELEAAELGDLPDLAGPMANQAAGRLPRL